MPPSFPTSLVVAAPAPAAGAYPLMDGGSGHGVDITELILTQHHEQRRTFALLDELADDPAGLAAVWERLTILLEVHAKAEEKFFYPRLLQVGTGGGDTESAESETKDAIKDHNEIREAIRAVRRSTAGGKEWWRAVTEANLANSDHMAEEERQDLTDFRQQTELELRHDIAVQFLRFEADHWATGVKPVDKDPEEFVEQNESS